MKETTFMRSEQRKHANLPKGVSFHPVYNLYLNGQPLHLVQYKISCNKTQKSSLWRKHK
jgi:hypothetical protein